MEVIQLVLLVVDTQKLLINNKLFNYGDFIKNVKHLINTARECGTEVIYVVHDDGVGNELTQGKEGFEVYEEFKPLADEKVFIKYVNSSFRDTGLSEYLKNNNEKEIIVVGLQTDKCMDATIKCGFEHGFHMIVPSYTNSTVDNEYLSAEDSYMYYNKFMWNERYAECVTLDKAFEKMKKSI